MATPTPVSAPITNAKPAVPVVPITAKPGEVTFVPNPPALDHSEEIDELRELIKAQAKSIEEMRALHLIEMAAIAAGKPAVAADDFPPAPKGMMLVQALRLGTYPPLDANGNEGPRAVMRLPGEVFLIRQEDGTPQSMGGTARQHFAPVTRDPTIGWMREVKGKALPIPDVAAVNPQAISPRIAGPLDAVPVQRPGAVPDAAKAFIRI